MRNTASVENIIKGANHYLNMLGEKLNQNNRGSEGLSMGRWGKEKEEGDKLGRREKAN